MASKEQRQNKMFVEKILQIQGIEYDDWVDTVHKNYIQSNHHVIFEALDSKLSQPSIELNPTALSPTEEKRNNEHDTTRMNV